MSITPIETVSIAPKSQMVSQNTQSVNHRVSNEQMQINQGVQQQVKNNNQKTAKTEKEEYRQNKFDAKEKGKNEYRQNGGQQDKKKSEDKAPPIKLSNFDIKI